LGLALIVARCACADDSGEPPIDGGDDETADACSFFEAAGDADASDQDGSLTACDQATANHSVAGCEYWAFSPNHLSEFGCGALLLSNPSTVDAQIALTYRTETLNPVGFMGIVQGAGPAVTYSAVTSPTIPAGKTALLALFQGGGSGGYCNCPVAAATSNAMVPIGAAGYGFHITSSVPIAAMFDHPFGCVQDHTEAATALRSVGNWDTRYRDVGTYIPGRPNIQRDFNGYHVMIDPTWTAAVASTTSTVTFEATDSGAQAFKLIGGNVLTLDQDDDYIGSLITSTAPFGLWTGGHTEIPFNWPTADLTYLQFAPVSDWASEYASVPFPSRYAPADLGSIWRIVGDADGTLLTYDPVTPTGAPSTLDAGSLATFRSTAPFVVRSQDATHAFHVSQLMTSCSDATGAADSGLLFGPDGGEIEGCPGDPELESTPPSWEFDTHYVFFTNPAYPTTKLVIIRKKDTVGFHDVTLDCAGVLGGWTAIGSDEYEYVYVTLSDGNFVAQELDGGMCDNGSHVADSTGPFSIAVWQWGTYAANVVGVIDYDNVSIGYLVPGQTASRRRGGDAGVN
jgi:IgGFc binding protein